MFGQKYLVYAGIGLVAVAMILMYIWRMNRAAQRLGRTLEQLERSEAIRETTNRMLQARQDSLNNDSDLNRVLSSGEF